MQNFKQARDMPTYIDEEFRSAWRLSPTRKRQIDAQVADGGSQEGASMQADFHFESYIRELKSEGELTTPEDAVQTFGQYDSKRNRWSVWVSSQARAEHTKWLSKLGFSDKAAFHQTDNDFRAYFSETCRRGASIQDDINLFERHTKNEQIKLAWRISEARERHIAALLAVGFSLRRVDAQADLNFSLYLKDMGITRASLDARFEEFEQYHESIFEYSKWDENRVRVDSKINE